MIPKRSIFHPSEAETGATLSAAAKDAMPLRAHKTLFFFEGI
jgi:hypothetical protein